MPEMQKNSPAVGEAAKNINSSMDCYIMSIAFTKEVVEKGRISVNHSQCVQIANINAAVEARHTNHQKPVYFFVCSIFLYLLIPSFLLANSIKKRCKNKAASLNEKIVFHFCVIVLK